MTAEQLALIGEGIKLAASLIAKALEIEKSGDQSAKHGRNSQNP